MGEEPTKVEGQPTIADPEKRRSPSGPPAAIGLQPGTVVGRYVVVQPLGRGGTSEVMLAHDTQLERNVALKVLLTDFASESGRMRMIREAQAMAQLSHPNVVAVFDVGTHEDNVFLALEYVEGETMQRWLRAPRSWREVLSVMKQAGRGLAAAHAAGIVHRDFKPANVVIAKDGCVKVLDFGIARSPGQSGPWTPEASSPPSADPPPLSPASTPSLGAPASLSSELTEEGTIVGTPGYFAPETVFDRAVDARSDVFSFCVTLWRALYGQAPYPTDSVTAYMHAIDAEELVPAPPGKRVPAWVHETVRRGLCRDPAGRPASMDELLRALEADPTRARLVKLAASLVALATIGVAAGVARHHRALRVECVAEGVALSPTWTDAARAELRAAVAASDDALGSDRSDRVVRGLDDFVARWSNQQRTSCEATRVDRTQPLATHERRSACLLAAREQFETVVQLLGARDPLVERRALDLVRDLSPPDMCKGKMVDNAWVPLPLGASARADAQEARRLTMRARVLDDSGRRDDALAEAQQARDLAHRAGVAADEAASILLVGTVQDHHGDDAPALQTVVEALGLAERSGADRIAGFAASEAAHLASNRVSRLDEARLLLDVARAKLDRLGGDEELELAILSTSVIIKARSNDLLASVQAADRLIAREKAVYGGANHLVCGHEYNRALSLLDMQDVDRAVAGLREAATCFESTTSPRDPWLGIVHMVLADALTRLGRLDEAKVEASRALELRGAQGPADPIRASILGIGAVIDELAERWGDAEDEARRALAIADGQTGWIADQMPNVLYALGVARLHAGDAAEARALCARGTDLLSQVGQPSPDKVFEGDTLRCLGEAELALGDVPHAREHLERSVGLPLRWHADDLPRARLALSRALGAGKHPDRARSRQLAEQARDELRQLVSTRPWLQPLLDGADQWLASR